jgi:predicted amidophosphoribosyltransferase
LHTIGWIINLLVEDFVEPWLVIGSNAAEANVMGRAYCPRCKQSLNEVLSSFECLATWNKIEKYYAPGDKCNLVRRCTHCGTLTREQKEARPAVRRPHPLRK